MDKYKEALEKARAEYEKAREKGYTWLMNLLEGMFPEVKESDDERIRKAIMEVLKRVSGATDVLENQGTTFKKAMIWLEKQKELDKMIVVSPEVWDKAIADAYENGKKDGEKQKEQKPAEWSEEDDKTLNRIINVLDILGYEEYCTSSRDQDVEEERLYYNEIQVLKKLKSLRPPQYCENCKLKRSVEKWKPSEAQMRYLLAVINDPNNIGSESCYMTIKSLYNDLKKL